MPSIVTHHIFAKEVYKNLGLPIQEKISYPHFVLFAQSFDNLFYYKFLTPWKGQDIRKFGETAQKEKVNEYFKNIIQEIEFKNLQKNKEVLGYLYGSICHYVLDYHCHPFIFYHTGDNHQKKYRGLHEKMEVNIDAYMYKKYTGTDLYKQNITNELLPKLKFSKELLCILDKVFLKTFQKENIGKIYEESTNTGNFLVKYGVTDKTGLKKQLYKLKDFLTPLSYRKYQYLSFHVTKFIPEYLNEQHEKWYNPADKNIQSTKSFIDLFEEAKTETIEIIKAIDEYLKKQKSLQEILEEIGNNSYTTGLPCDKPYTLKYFKN